jgi:phage terminase Nu1 subunit (DNA packaging protein)
MILTINEFAKKYKVSRQTVNNWRKKGLPVLKGASIIRIDEEKAIEWMSKDSKEKGEE